MTQSESAVLLMAYGTPSTLDDVEEYFTHIRGGRTPSPESVANLRERYERVGGGTPLLAITEQVRARLEQRLAQAGTPRPVYIGMRHWHPYIADTLQRMKDDGVTRITAVALAPHYSLISIGAYRRAVQEANDALGSPFAITFIERWHDKPEFIAMMADLVRGGLAKFSDEERPRVRAVFTAHSLPQRIREWKDPYEAELLASSRAVAEKVGVGDWSFAWQSAGGTGEPWIGPDILDYLQTLRDAGVREVLQIPIGFVSDHLEVLYDIDVEAMQKARELGIHLERTALPNASDAMIDTLAAVVGKD